MKFSVRAFGFLVLVNALSASLVRPAFCGPVDLGAAGDFAVLGLQNGTVIINSATSLVGNVGYCWNQVSTTNQKVDFFTGAAYVHSTATFNHTPATFAPSAGIHFGSSEATVDPYLDQAHTDALAASAAATVLPPTHVLGVLGDNDSRTVNSTGPVNVVSISSLDYNSDHLDFVTRPGFEDFFIVNVSGDFAFSQSQINLVGVGPGHVLFNFPNASNIDINKSSTIFFGTILAPLGDLTYHNPATFEGAIIALHINLHSDFNLSHVPFGEGPVPVESTTWSRIKSRF
jgi:choice-of-anchor A domain-containing protein